MAHTIYLVRSGESVPRESDRDRPLSLSAKDRLRSLRGKIEENMPSVVFYSDTKRAEQTMELLWPTVKKQKISGLYTPIEQMLFTEVKTFLQHNNITAIRSVWAKVHSKNDVEKAITNLYDLCYRTSEEIIEKTVTISSFAIVGHEVTINLIGYFFAHTNINKKLLLNQMFEHGEIRILKPETVIILPKW